MKHRPPNKPSAKQKQPHKRDSQPFKKRPHADGPRSPATHKITITLFGQHAVREAWLNPQRHVHHLYATAGALKSFEDILHKAGTSRPAPTMVEKDVLDKALPHGTVHQGLALHCGRLAEMGLDDLLIRAKNNDKSLFVILDQVTDPHNMGAILRSACAFGADGIIVQKRHAPELEGPAGAIIAKTACGALEHTPIAYETNLSRSIEALQEAGYFVYGLDERGEDMPASPPPRAVLVLGAEGDGLRHLVKEKCDVLVKLPTKGPIASLNVSNAAAVALYAFAAG